jgi:hypothetical protein
LKDDKGVMHVGGFDPSYSASDFAVYPLRYNNRYSLLVTSVNFNHRSVASNLEARINPAVAFIYLPYDVILALIEQMVEFYKPNFHPALCGLDENVFFGHSIIHPPSDLPSFELNLQGFTITLKGFLQKHSNDQYYSVIRNGGQTSVLGSPVLENLYLVLDLENSRVALAPLAKCQQVDDLVLLTAWEQSLPVVLCKLAMMLSALAMIVLIGW